MPFKMYPASSNSQIKSIIAIAAGKGGVGKSTMTVNLALALNAQGFQVGIMDTDIYGPSIRKMLKEDRLPSENNDLIEPALCQGIKVISMGYFKKESEALIVRAPIANQLMSKFLNKINWGKLDFLLIDFPPGTGDIQLTLSQQAKLTGAIMVTTPQEIALLDVRKAMQMFSQVKVPILGIIENMSYYQIEGSQEKKYLFGKGGGERLSLETGSLFLGAVPLNPHICHCCDQGTSLFESNEKIAKSIQENFIQITRALIEGISSTEGQKSPLLSLGQKNAYSITIQWSDGNIQNIDLNEIQKNCPCANCINETTGQRLLDIKSLKKDVRAISLQPVGRYAIQIQFSSGCSTGIYSFEQLRAMKSQA